MLNIEKTSITALLNRKCEYVVAFEDGIPVCIAPLCIDSSPCKTMRILGSRIFGFYL